MSPPPNSNGKKGRAPCGHVGTAVTPNFYTCDVNCGEDGDDDAIPEHIDPEKTRVYCKYCGDEHVKKWSDEFRKDDMDFWTCRGCGKSFHA